MTIAVDGAAIVREATRDTVGCKIILKPDVADKLVSEPDLKVMIFCASEPISHFSKVDVTFPHQVEIKVNLDEVKANLRGLKNRAGSTRPADITNLLRKRAHYENSMSVTYALTHKVSSLYWLKLQLVAIKLTRLTHLEILFRRQSCEAAFC